MGSDITETTIVSNLEELKAALDGFPEGSLSRGQTGHYTTEDGLVNLPTSQLRRGCIPSELRKWSFYAKEAITAMNGGNTPSSELVQALLQHYGWRSFYIDLTSSPAVSCWFAGYKYSERDLIQLAQDYKDREVLLHRRDARYSEQVGDGHLYIIDPQKVIENGAKCINLSDELNADFPARHLQQKGWLAGPLKGPLAPDCLLGHITGPAEVFRQYAEEHGLTETQQLFPSSNDDKFLELFEAIPWERIIDSNPAFIRNLSIPDYHATAKHRFGPEVAFPMFSILPKEKGQITFLVPSEMFYAGPSMPESGLLSLANLVRDKQFIRIETTELIRFPELYESYEYCKGLCIRAVNANVFEIGALMVDHPGLDLLGAGLNAGWYYEVDSQGKFTRIEMPAQCPCDKPFRHEQLLSSAVAFDWLLNNREPKNVSARLFDYS